MARSDVAEFYAGRTILVTGATGFLGKALIEKFLRSVPDLRQIYALVRPNKTMSAVDRWRETTDGELFNLIRKEHADKAKSVFDKVVVINSDMMEPELGLAPDDVKRICEDVSVVFHCAATVKFDEHIRIAVRMNIQGTQRLLRLCDKMKHLDAFVHCSTAFCNCDRTHVMERVYPAHVSPQKLIDICEWMNDDMLGALSPSLIGRRPNTYTMTKALTENLLVEQSSHLPITIVRPSIVVGAWREPEPGWIDNYNGATGLMALTIKGLVRALYGRLDSIKADIVPVDIVCNLMIVAGWHRGVGKGNTMPVIHCSSDRLNPVTWGRLVNWSEENFRLHMPLAQLYREPGGAMTTWRLEYRTRLFLDHIVPAYLIDFIMFMMGKRRFMVRLYDRIFKVLDTLEYFYSNEWDHQAKMAVLLHKQLSEDDRRRFYMDVREIDWKSYTYDLNIGIRKYILREDMSTVPEGFRVQSRRRLVYKAMKLGLWAFILRFFVRKTKIGARLWAVLMTFLGSLGRKLYLR